MKIIILFLFIYFIYLIRTYTFITVAHVFIDGAFLRQKFAEII